MTQVANFIRSWSIFKSAKPGLFLVFVRSFHNVGQIIITQIYNGVLGTRTQDGRRRRIHQAMAAPHDNNSLLLSARFFYKNLDFGNDGKISQTFYRSILGNLHNSKSSKSGFALTHLPSSSCLFIFTLKIPAQKVHL